MQIGGMVAGFSCGKFLDEYAVSLGELGKGHACELARPKTAIFPAVYRANGNAQLMCELLLGHLEFAAQIAHRLTHLIKHQGDPPAQLLQLYAAQLADEQVRCHDVFVFTLRIELRVCCHPGGDELKMDDFLDESDRSLVNRKPGAGTCVLYFGILALRG
jgi:hypothetical protein